MNGEIWATMVVFKCAGGRAVILNESKRGLFNQGGIYYNHRLKDFPRGCYINVTVRLSKTGRRMVQELRVLSKRKKWLIP